MRDVGWGGGGEDGVHRGNWRGMYGGGGYMTVVEAGNMPKCSGERIPNSECDGGMLWDGVVYPLPAGGQHVSTPRGRTVSMEDRVFRVWSHSLNGSRGVCGLEIRGRTTFIATTHGREKMIFPPGIGIFPLGSGIS